MALSAPANRLVPANVSASSLSRSKLTSNASAGGSNVVPAAFLPKAGLSSSSSCSSSSSSPKPKHPVPSSRRKALEVFYSSVAAVAAAAGGGYVFQVASHLPPPPGGGVGGGGGGGSWGGGGGGGAGGFWSDLFSPLAACAKDEGGGAGQDWDPHGLPILVTVRLRRLSDLKRYKISEIFFFDHKKRKAVAGEEDSFFEFITLRPCCKGAECYAVGGYKMIIVCCESPIHAHTTSEFLSRCVSPGGVYTKAQLQAELKTLASCGMFDDNIDFDCKMKPDGTLGLTVVFTESTWLSPDALRCINVGLMPRTRQMEADSSMGDDKMMKYYRKREKDYRSRIGRSRPCLLPTEVCREVTQMIKGKRKVTSRLLQRIRYRVQKWYHDEGYACAHVFSFGNLNTKEVVCEIVEGDITKLDIQFQDKHGNACEGNTQLAVIHRELPEQLQPGHVFNIEASKLALRNINSLCLFSDIEVKPRPDGNNEGGVTVEIKLKEHDQKSSEVGTALSIVSGSQGWPTLASIQPGGTVSFEHRNINGLNRSIVGSVTSSSLLSPQDDLSFKLEYVHPYVDGVSSTRNRTFHTSCFNSRKLSPIFIGGPGVDEVPPVWIDRAGFKVNITENFTRQSKFTCGVVVEEITTRDETSSICTHGSRALPSGGLTMYGPSTTLSGTGIDRMVFAQANITRDNTKFVNGTVVGERDVFQLDQGLGISTLPLFNRHQLTLTRFIQLKNVEEGVGKPPPPVLVLHGHYGGCVGDLPSYDAFALGGPYSVRGYNMGELGACRNILEVAVELRIPLLNTHIYLFAEHGNDLGSSNDLNGNPTEFFRRAGHGSSYGAGVKLGLVRAEYAVDHNSGTGSVFFRFGERF